MTGKEVVDIIDALAAKLGTTGAALIEAYIPWVATTAWVFMALGAMILFF
jgi:hypothetical protein